MLEPKIALILLALIFITTCQSLENHEPDSNPKGGSIEANLQTWKFKDGYLINKQMGKKYSYGNITWSLEPPGSKSYFHIVQTTISTNPTCKTVSGPVPNVTCIFPFKIADITYSSCVRGGDYNENRYWCPIKVDTSGVYEYSSEDSNTWGDCASDCQTVDTPLGKHNQCPKLLHSTFINLKFQF